MDSELDRLGEGLERLIRDYTQGAFSDTVIEEASNPKNMRRLAEPDAYGTVHGWCGDTMEIYLRLAGERIEIATFMTDGCGPTVACGSMLTKMVTKASTSEAERITPAQLIEALDGLPPENAHCAALAIRTLQVAIRSRVQPASGPTM
ncbi:iron-sulfur cluster assembly scaffold protein [Candidatus Bipolaricaulota bacterium]